MIWRDGRFLVGKRSLQKQSAPGTWCAIVGGIEPGETQEEALQREVREETGLLVSALRRICQTDSRDGKARLHWWLAVPVGPSRQPRLANEEHSELRWVSVDELRRLEPVFLDDVEIFAEAAATMDAPPP
jgi:8-oxo-dGTP pyrophosphatase MutT (NUDIX family)